MMHMTFYWGKKVTLVFDSWKSDSWLSYALTLLVCFLFSVFYQFMEDRRLRLKIMATEKLSSSSINGPLLPTRFPGSRWSNPVRFDGAVFFGVNSAIGYLSMLGVMSFNGGVFIAVVLGLAFGYLIFRRNDEQLVALEYACACSQERSHIGLRWDSCPHLTFHQNTSF